MGASGWRYAVAWDADIDGVVQRLRWQVFRAGEYYRESDDELGDCRMAQSEAEFEATLRPRDEDSGINDALRDAWRQARDRVSRGAPGTPDELVDAQPYSGTHSVIDMVKGVRSRPEMFAVSPLTDQELLAAFGTTTPDDQAVTAWLDGGAAWDLRERWQGLYVIGYLDGAPARVHLVGSSGD
ncbi:MAG TPA: hypothetical protein VFP72_15405 [Kineosporiaceae bacterium]|nr:hypothetical protein [Kineosporiaceae bacterium]